MKKRILLLVVSFVFLSNISYSSGMVMDFSDGMIKLCSKNKSILLTKKMFLTILRLEEQGVDPCDNDGLKKLVNSCSEENKCNDILAVYKRVVLKYEGRVLGR